MDEGRLLLIESRVGTGLWGLPGGGLEAGESPVEGPRREFTEETGYAVEGLDYGPLARIRANFYADDKDKFYRSERYFFRIKKAAKHGRHKDAREIKKKWHGWNVRASVRAACSRRTGR